MSAAVITEAIEQAELALASLSQPPGPSPDEVVRAVTAFRAACAALDATGSRAIPVLAGRLTSPDPLAFSHAQAAARILAELADPDAASALLQAALSEDPTVSFRAWFALRNLRRSAASYTRIADVVQDAGADGARGQRDVLADAMGRQLTADRYGEVAAWASSHSSAYVRQSIVKALARGGGPQAVLHLRAALADGDPIVSSWAAFGLVLESHDEAAFGTLLTHSRAKRAEVRVEAIGLLGVLPVPAAVEPLIDATRDRSGNVRLAAIVGCGNMGVRQCLPALAKLLAHDHAQTVEQAAAVLATLLGRDPGYAWQSRRVAPEAVQRVQVLCRDTFEQWGPDERHVRGAVMTAGVLAEALLGFDTGAAFWSFVGMAGQRFDFDPAADLIANWDAVERLRAWASADGAALRPGGFYLCGRLIPATLP